MDRLNNQEEKILQDIKPEQQQEEEKENGEPNGESFPARKSGKNWVFLAS
jgi:hypothetical protein